MKTKIQKWGNSLGVRLPKSIAEQKSLRAGLDVSILLQNDEIVIKPDVEQVSLDTFLRDIKPENLHSETDWSETVGNEVW